jgi:hypothetical protein
MKIFHLTSTTFNGHIEFHFNDNTLLEKMEIHAELSENQQIYLLKNMPRELPELYRLKSPTVTITEVKHEVTFEMFWEKYDDRVNSSKKRTFQKWEKMTAADRARAYWFIPKYFGALPQGTRKKFAETYLNAELWNN